MIYAHYDIRYIAHAFPEVYSHYTKHEQDFVSFADLRHGWSFTGSVPDPQRKVERLQKLMWKKIEGVRSFN